jgi:class 3 adenylate cyclase/CHASE2 domain-containing sensor protein
VRTRVFNSPAVFIAAPVILAVCLLEIAHPSGLHRFELLTFDLRVRLAHCLADRSMRVPAPLGLVEISDNTIRAVKNGSVGFHHGLYWPRDVYATALNELTLQGAKVVAFDVLFHERREDQGMVALPNGAVESPDDIFAAQIKKSGNVILAADSELTPDRKFSSNAWRIANISTDLDPDSVLRRERPYLDYRDWDPVILDAAAQLMWDLSKTVDDRTNHTITFFSQLNGEATQFPTDEAGRIAATNLLNTVPAGFPPSIAPYRPFRAWSLGILLAAYELKLDLDHAMIEPGRMVLHGADGLSRSVPLDSQGCFYIDWSLTQDDPRVRKGALELLLGAQVERRHGQPVADAWTNALVIIGSTATGNDLRDCGATPLDSYTHLVNKHLNIASSFLTGRFVRSTPLSINLLLIIVAGGLAAWITWVVERPFNGTLLMLGFSVVYLVLAAWLYVAFRIWAPVFLPLVCAGLGTHGLGLIHRVRFEQSQRKRVKQLFSRLVSPEIVNEVLKTETMRVGGQRREVTVCFADVRGFTELTDLAQEQAAQYVKECNLSGRDAEDCYDARARETLETVSTYLAMVADIVKSHKGTLDKYIGDCVMAFWGAPLPNPQHALDAVRAAIEAQRAISALNLEREQANRRREEENAGRAGKGLPLLASLPVLSVGIGINTGTAIVGLMGSDTHQLNYTAFGREVNLASRLESVSGHGRILIGEATFAAIQRDDPKLAAQCVEWAPRAVKGFREAVRIYEVQWQPRPEQPPHPTGPA